MRRHGAHQPPADPAVALVVQQIEGLDLALAEIRAPGRAAGDEADHRPGRIGPDAGSGIGAAATATKHGMAIAPAAIAAS